MRRGVIRLLDSSPDESPERPHLASWYTQGRSDGFGDRILMFDNSTSAPLELLRFRSEFGDNRAFVDALGRRLESLADFRHASVAEIRAVKSLGSGEGVALVSTHVEGRLLSDLLREGGSAALAWEVVRQLTPVLSAIQAATGGVAHGALTPDRVVLTPDGRFVITEHALGAALDAIAFPAARAAAELGIVALPERDTRSIAERDRAQLGFVALAALLGRPIDPGDAVRHAPALLAACATSAAARAPEFDRLHEWLDRALPLPPPLAADARTPEPVRASIAAAGARPVLVSDAPLSPEPLIAASPAAPAVRARTNVIRLFDRGGDDPDADEPRSPPPVPRQSPASSTRGRLLILGADDGSDEASDPPAVDVDVDERSARRFGPLHWTIAALGVLSLAQALVIVLLLHPRSPAMSTATPPAARAADASASTAARTPPDARATRTFAPRDGAVPNTAAAGVADATRSRTSAARNDRQEEDAKGARGESRAAGRLRVSAPLTVVLFEHGAMIGTSDAPIHLASGRHTIDLVSTSVGYRSRQTVDIRADGETTLDVSIPPGRLTVRANAVGEVAIDGKPAGMAPVSDVSMAAGRHQVIVTGAQGRSRTETVVVKSGETTTVTVNPR